MMPNRFASQRGAVLLLALLAVALISAMLSTVLWRQSGLIRVETAERELRGATLDEVRRNVCATIACRAAIKINMRLDQQKKAGLVDGATDCRGFDVGVGEAAKQNVAQFRHIGPGKLEAGQFLGVALGEAGVGKTAIVEEFSSDSSQSLTFVNFTVYVFGLPVAETPSTWISNGWLRAPPGAAAA